jgi:hypothetical protein
MKKVILHIGLPKTATTLLQQHIFPQLRKYIDYIGVRQPRTLDQESIYADIWNLVCVDQVEYNKSLGVVKARLQNRLDNNDKPFVFSEECFCLDSGSTIWQEKLNRLATIFRDYDIQILVTVRNPISAIFSYYIELYPKIKNKHSDVVHFANESNLSKIYKYKYLESIIISSFGNVNIDYVPFESIKNETFLPLILEAMGIEDRCDLLLPDTNFKKKNHKGVKTQNRNILSYTGFISKNPILSAIIKMPIIRPILDRLRDLLKNFKIPLSHVQIEYPTKIQVANLTLVYEESITFINTKIIFKY